MLTGTNVLTTPHTVPGKGASQCRKPIELHGHTEARNFIQSKPYNSVRGHNKRVASNPRGLGLQLQPVDGRKRSMNPSLTICAAASDSTCSGASGESQTATLDRKTESKTETKIPEKTPILDGSGPPPNGGNGGGGGGGGGGGEGNGSGGFYLFGFLAFLDFLKDQEKSWVI